MARDMHLKEKKEEIAQAREKLLESVKDDEKLENSFWRTCAAVSLLQFEKGEGENKEVVVEDGFFCRAGCLLFRLIMLKRVLKRPHYLRMKMVSRCFEISRATLE